VLSGRALPLQRGRTPTALAAAREQGNEGKECVVAQARAVSARSRGLGVREPLRAGGILAPPARFMGVGCLADA